MQGVPTPGVWVTFVCPPSWSSEKHPESSRDAGRVWGVRDPGLVRGGWDLPRAASEEAPETWGQLVRTEALVPHKGSAATH